MCTGGSEASGFVKRRMTMTAIKFITCGFDPNWKPVIEPCVLIASTRGSIIRLKIVGVSGHPWWVPLDVQKGVDKMPVVYTCAEGQEYKVRTAFKMHRNQT